MPPSDTIVVSGAREHNLKNVSIELPRDALVVITGLSGSGQVLARLRHDLRRGPAPLRRVAERLRAPVPGADGQAGRRLDRGPVAGDLDRPEDDLAQPALDGRHGHRDLRLPAPAVVARRPSALPQLRRADRRPVGRADHRPGDGAARGARASWCSRRSCAGARASTASSSRSCAPTASRARRSTASCACSRTAIELDKKYKHDISVVVDRLVMRPDLRKRLADSIETAVGLADGIVEIEIVPRDEGERADDPDASRRSSPA